MTNVDRCTVTTLGVGRPSSSSGEEWQSFKMLFHGFADLPSAVGQYTLSPEFTCNGRRWCIQLFPGGKRASMTGCLSLYLELRSGGTATATLFEASTLDKFQSVKHSKKATVPRSFSSENKVFGWSNFDRRSYILKQSENILDDNGTLAIVVSIQRDSASPFVPRNPMSSLITGMFLDEETADVCFEVSSADVHEDDGDDAALSPVTFHAHSFVLKTCAPMLASLFGSDDEKIVVVSINDVKPAIFRHLLHYVYGGSVEEGELTAHVKDIINAADKYSIVNLKLQAEAAYVESTDITMDNAMDNLLYADALNLALLKEVVMDFLAENHDEAIGSLSFDDVPGNVVKDLMVAFGRKMKGDTNEGSKDGLNTMRVSELRRKLAEIGLGVDGSREAMIEALLANAGGFAVDSNEEGEEISDEDSGSDEDDEELSAEEED
eukprot:scaffold1761_cov78-Skeletonema_dohrnii-CCMP3373.AAC.4